MKEDSLPEIIWCVKCGDREKKRESLGMFQFDLQFVSTCAITRGRQALIYDIKY